MSRRQIIDAQSEELLGYRDCIWNKRVVGDFSKVDIDVCGTGGSRKPRFNVLTSVAFILASLDINVVKHGNRGSVTNNGSFDFLEALGLPITKLTEKALELHRDLGLSFCFARDWHPSVSILSVAYCYELTWTIIKSKLTTLSISRLW